MLMTTTWAWGPVETTSRKYELRFARARMSSLNGTMNFCVARGMATSLSCKFALRLAHPPEPNGLSSAPAWWIWGSGRDMTDGREVRLDPDARLEARRRASRSCAGG